MIDIDYFKKVNDTYGHLIGDSVLKKVADIIKTTAEESTNPDDILVARYGGEEFIVLKKTTTIESMHELMERVRKNVEATVVEEEGEKIKFTVSIGISEFPSTSSNIHEAIKDCDSALYNAKESGRNRIEDAFKA
jgi:diguanylate cyclase (GGDEF)-like protein